MGINYCATLICVDYVLDKCYLIQEQVVFTTCCYNGCVFCASCLLVSDFT